MDVRREEVVQLSLRELFRSGGGVFAIELHDELGFAVTPRSQTLLGAPNGSRTSVRDETVDDALIPLGEGLLIDVGRSNARHARPHLCDRRCAELRVADGEFAAVHGRI